MMPVFLLIIGIVLVITGVQNTQSKLYALLQGDFTGPGNFVYWVVALVILGSIGFIKPIRPISDAFLVLVLLVFILKNGSPQNGNGGFFSQFNGALQSFSNTPSGSSQ